MNDEKAIAGFKRSEFANATPEKVFGPDVRIEELPEGVRLYLREKAIDLNTKKCVVNVYRVVDDGGMKNKRVWVGKINNRKPDEDEIAERFGGGDFVWILKWLSADGQERGILSEVITIDEDFGRAAHEAWRRKQSADIPPAAATVPAATAPAAGGFGNDAAALMRLMDAAEERTLSRIERIAHIFKGSQSDTPAEVLKTAYQGASDMMRSAVETNLNMAKAVNKANQNTIAKPAAEEKEEPAVETGREMPEWLSAFMPHIEKGLSKLLGGGPIASAVKTLVISSEEWQDIFNDPEKWGQAVAAMEQRYGSEKTRAALDILLNRRQDKNTKKGGK